MGGVRLVADVLLRVVEPINGVRVVGDVVLPVCPDDDDTIGYKLFWPGGRDDMGVRTPDLTTSLGVVTVLGVVVVGAPRGLLLA